MKSMTMNLVMQVVDGKETLVEVYTIDGKPVSKNEYDEMKTRVYLEDQTAHMEDVKRMDAIDAAKQAAFMEAKAEREAVAVALQEKLGLSDVEMDVLRGTI